MIPPDNIAAFFNFMKAREEIRHNRALGKPAPWSFDAILTEYKFTNVKREHDRTSRKLRELFYEPHADADPGEILFNCGVARYFGTWEFAVDLGWTKKFEPAHIKDVARHRAKLKERVFTGAYVITNQGIEAPKIDVVVDYFLTPLWNNRQALVKTAKRRDSWQDLITAMAKFPGFGGTGFMAKEIVLDTTFTEFWFGACPSQYPADFDTWCPAGPGARRGVARLLGLGKDGKVSPEKCLAVMRELFAARVYHWPEPGTQSISGDKTVQWPELVLHDIQFQLCEFDKYERVRLGEGKPRSKFVPTLED